jgi:hypothetical protein
MISDGMNDSQQAGSAPAGSGGSAPTNARENPAERVTTDVLTPAAHADAAPSALAASKPSPLADWLRTAASCVSAVLARPPLRLIATGAVLLLIGGLLVPNSVWTLPVVIIGALMVAIGWVGGRLDGRFAVEWGQSGTQLEFRARIAAPPHERPSLPRPFSRSRERAAIPGPAPQDPETEIIEAAAHTIEFDLAELEALIVAAETPDTPTSPPASARAVQKLRVARGGQQ